MNRVLLVLSMLFAIGFVHAISIIGPSESPKGQYHPISEIWVSESILNWKGVSFENINNLYIKGKLGIGTSSPTTKLHISGGGIKIANSGEQVDIAIDKNNPSIELRDTDGSGLSPYIDFSNDAHVDYDVRIILTGDNELTIAGGGLKIEGDIVPSGSNRNLGSGANIWKRVYVREVCLNSACTARIYWDDANGVLVIEAPQIAFESTS